MAEISGLALVCPLAAQVAPRHREELHDYDVRDVAPTASAQSAARAGATDPAAALRPQVRDVRVDRDPLHGGAGFVRSTTRFLTGAPPSPRTNTFVAPLVGSADPQAAVKSYVDEHTTFFGHGSDALSAARLQRDYVTRHNGMRTLVWEQQLDGIPVFGATFQAHVAPRGELVNVASRFLTDLSSAAERGTPSRAARVAAPRVSPTQAVAIAVQSIGERLSSEQVTARDVPQGSERRQAVTAAGISDAQVRFVWLPLDPDTLRLAWEVVFASRTRGEMFRVIVDAETGQPQVRHNLTNYISNASYRVFTSDSPTPFSPGHATPLSTQPAAVNRTLVTTQALDTTASPNGWIDDGINETRGNNVDAHTDLDANNSPDLPRPQGTGTGRVFDFALDLTQSPTTYRDASVVNLFFWCNWMHDRLYSLGFTEAAGNFQNDNFSRGGLGNDAVQADSQDGSGTDNANFSTPPDGSPGRMQMYVFTGPSPNRDSSLDAEVILHEYTHGLSNRLVGGGVGISALQSRGMGEGWSDFYSLALLSEAGDDLAGNYAAGAYSSYQLGSLTQNYYFGIRRYPYSTNLTKNPLTFKDIDPTQASTHTGISRSPILGNTADEVHNIGEVWCAVLWEARANLVNKHGYTIGNELMLQLVTDGMKLSPANPNFLQARDAILEADLVATGGANRMELWNAFAKRGMGAHATSPSSNVTVGLVENFDLPDDLGVGPSDVAIFSGTVGGPFKPASVTYTLVNSGTSSLSWTASDNATWLDLSAANGTLAPGANVTVTATPNATAGNFGVGVQTATLTFTNATSGIAQTRTVRLEVEPFTVPIFTDTFESGTLDSAHWQTSGTGPWRTQVTTANAPHGGTHHLTMDSSTDYSYARNEATLTLDLTGEHGLQLKFWAKMFNDEPDGPPGSPFTTGANFDGVAISADGQTWYEVQPLRSPAISNAWQQFTVDLDAAIAARGLSYTSAFKIRFNQYDNYPIATDGIAIDDVAVIRVINNRVAFTLPAAINENAAAYTATITATPVPTTALTVTLTSSQPSLLAVPATVTIPAGQASATFAVTPVDDALLNGTRSVTITAAATGWAGASSIIAVNDNETATLSVSLPAATTEGTTDLTGTVTVSAAPASNVVVQLASDDVSETLPPATVIILAGQTSATFSLFVNDDNRIDGDHVSTITASVANWTSGRASITVHDNESTALALVVPANVREGDSVATGTVRIAGTLTTDLVVALSSSDTTEITLPATATIRAGQTSAIFPVTIVDDVLADGAQPVVITASATGFTSATANVTVADNDAHHFAVAPIGASQVRNAPFAATITAQDVNNATITNYNSAITLSASAAGATVPLTPATVDGSAFVNGVWTGAVAAGAYANGVVLTAADAGGHAGSSNAFDVAAGPLHHFAWNTLGSPQTLDSPIGVTITAQDIGNNTIAYSNAANFAVSLPTQGPAIDAGTYDWAYPMNTAYHDARSEVIYLASELGEAKRLSGLRLYVTTSGTTTMNNWTIRMKHTLRTDLSTTAWDGAGWVVVHQSNLAPPSAGWITFNFTTPFDYDGTSNLLVDFSFNNSASGSAFTPCRYTSTATARTLYGVSNSQNGDPLTWSGTTGAQASYTWAVPNVQWIIAPRSVPLRPPTSGNFTAGIWTGAVSVPVVGSNLTLSATGTGGITGLSNPITIAGPPPAITPTTVFTEDFESGSLSSAWTVTGTYDYRTQITTANGPHGGTRHLTMDSAVDGNYSRPRNEATLTVDLAGRTGVVLNFWAKMFDDDPDGPPASPFTGGANFDGVAISADGNTWWEVQPLRWPTLTNAWSAFTVNLDAAIAAHGISYNSTFRIRFNQVDEYSIPTDGIAIDDIAITATPVGTAFALSVPAQAQENAGTVTGTITLNVAESAAVTFNLASSAPAKATVPASVTIPAGQTSGSFSITIIDDALVDGDRVVRIAATAANHQPTSAALTVVDNDAPTIALTLPATVTEGGPAGIGTIAVAGAVAIPVPIALTSNDSTTTVPASVTVPIGIANVGFPITALNDNRIEGPQTVTIAAAAGAAQASGTLTVLDDENTTLTLVIPPTLREGDGVRTASVRLSGILTADLAVALASSDTTEATVPALVTIPAGQTAVNFSLNVVDDADADGPQPVTITATATGFTAATVTRQVQDNDAHHFSIATIGSPLLTNAPIPLVITARDAANAPMLDYNATILLSATSSGGALTIVPSSTNAFFNGVWTGTAQITTAATNVVINASDGQGHTGTSNAFNLVAGSIDHFAWDTIPAAQAIDTPFAITVRAVDAANAVVTNYNGAANLSVLANVTNPQVGTGSSGLYAPLYTYQHDLRADMLFRASELSGAAQITGLAVNIQTASNEPLTNFTIRLKPTALTSLGSSVWDNTGWTTVYTGNPTISNSGWMTFPFTTPFSYNGTSNLVVEWSMDRTSAAGYYTYVIGTDTSYASTMWAASNSANGDPLTWTTSPYPSSYYGRPNLRFVTQEELPARPSITGPFVNGVWTGQLSVPVSGSNLALRARTGSTIAGTSNTFGVAAAVLPTGGGASVFTEDFESGVFSSAWTITGTGNYRTQNTTANYPRGQRHMAMDSTSYSSSARNEATLTVNLAGRTGVTLSFWAQAGYYELPDGPPPSPFPSTGADFDGVAISADGGTNWYEVHPLRNLATMYAQQTVDLDSAIATHGLSYTSNFKIRFNQYGNDYLPYKGITIDDIAITANPITALIVALPVQATEGDTGVSGTVTLGTVRTTDTVVTLTSTAPAKAAVPATVTIPAGQLSANFAITVPDDNITDGDRLVAISAAMTGGTPVGSVMLVADNDPAVLSLTIPATVTESAGTVYGTLSLAPRVAGNLTVALSSSDATAATVPASITLGTAQSTATVPITIIDDGRIDGTQTATITATVGNWRPAVASIDVTDDEAATFNFYNLYSLYEGGSSVATIYIGGSLPNDLTVNLTSSNTARLTVPSTIVVPAGLTYTQFTVSAPDNTLTDGAASVTITATAPGFTTGSTTVSVYDNDIHHFALAPIGAQTTGMPFYVSIGAYDVGNILIQTYSGTATLTAASDAGSSAVTPASATFSYGSWYGNVTLGQAGANMHLTATAGAAAGNSNAFAVAQAPTISVSPTSIAATTGQGTTVSRNVTITNSGGGVLNWNLGSSTTLRGEIIGGPMFLGGPPAADKSAIPPRLGATSYTAPRAPAAVATSDIASLNLSTILANLNANADSVRALIPNRYAFGEGVTSYYISDGGGDMYDGGNILGASVTPGSYLNYSDNAIVSTALLGGNGRYFTRKYDGLFVFAADISALSYFEITGNLGADGSGATDTAVLTAQRDGISYRGFVKRVFNAGDPSVNHLVIVADNGSVTHTASTSTDDDQHRILNLSGVTRLYYLLFAGTNGAYIDNTAMQTLMAAFLDAAATPAWIVPSPVSGSLSAGNSQIVTLTLGAPGMAAGTYTRPFGIDSNDVTQPAVSVPVTLTLTPAPVITTQPVSQSVTAGGNVSFRVVATDPGPLTYQWQKNGVSLTNSSHILGATTSTLTIASTVTSDTGSYTVVVSSATASTVSAAAALTVTAPPAPPPAPPPSGGGGGGGGGGVSTGGGGGGAGGGSFSAPRIVTQPTNKRVTVGADVQFVVSAQGFPEPNYQWRKNGAPIVGAMSAVLTLNNVQLDDQGGYSVFVSNSLGNVTSAVATLEVVVPTPPPPVEPPPPPPPAVPIPPSIVADPVGLTVTEGERAELHVSANGTSPLAYQWTRDGSLVAGATTDTFTLAAASLADAGSYRVMVSNALGAVISGAAQFSVMPAASAPSITAQPVSAAALAGGDVEFSVTAIGTMPLAYEWKKDGVPVSGGTGATLALHGVQAATTGSYTVTITNSIGTVTSSSASLTIAAAAIAPSIVLQPAGQTVALGASAVLVVRASGTSPLAYQWHKNGVPIDGATRATYRIPVQHIADTGSFSVTVTNTVGSVASNVATVGLAAASQPAIISDVADVTARTGARAVFTVIASGDAPLSYQWKKNGAAVAGATGATLVLSNVQAADAAFYSVVITNNSGTAASRPATLTVRGRSFAGTYFGSFGSGGSFGLTVRDDNSGVFLGYASGAQVAFVSRAVTVDDAGGFRFTTTSVPNSAAGTAAAAVEYSFDGTIGSDGAISGSVSGLATSLSANRASDSGASRDVAGFYQAGAVNASATTYTIVGPDGRAFLLTMSPEVTDGDIGQVDANGRLSLQTAAKTTVTGTIAASTLSANVATARGTQIAVTGGSETRAEVEKLLNLSTRNSVSSSSGALIAGFVVSGDAPKPVLVRAIGPALRAFGLGNALAAARLELFSGAVPVASNNGWDTASNASDVIAAQQRSGAFALAPGTKDAAVLVTLEPGAYTAVVNGDNNAAGVTLVEVYDVSQNAAAGQKVVNIASRGFAGTGENTLTAGFVVSGTVPKRLLLRGVGPGLAAFGVGGTLTDPELRVYSGSTIIASNDNWGERADAAQIASAALGVGAFAYAPGSRDAALLINLAPGAYTVQVLGTNNGVGIALVEVYEVQQ